ncbi:MAG: HU family DNA-binding protein [Spirochaetaceae bacterium]
MERFEDLPRHIQQHLELITESSGLPSGSDSRARITANWLEKRRMFDEQSNLLELQDLDRLDADDPRGVLVLTYSGSLVTLGPLPAGTAAAAAAGAAGEDAIGAAGEVAADSGRTAAAAMQGRWFEYASMPLRSDVPSLVREDGVSLSGVVRRDEPLVLQGSSIGKTSPVLRIAACSADVPTTDQERRLREATIFLTNGFVKLNRTLTFPEGEGEVEHFTTRAMVRYVADKNGITQKLARQVIDDFFTTAASGALLGERVPLGRLGRLHLAVRPAQKARMGRNPATGEEMLIPAKPRTAVPKMSFSSYLRDRAAVSSVAVEAEAEAEAEAEDTEVDRRGAEGKRPSEADEG